MSLRDYVVTRDKFQLHDKGTVGLELSFPCCHCQHRNMRDTDEPCRTCDHNVNAVKDTANAPAHLPPASGGKVPPDVRHPSGFASWQDLSGYLRDYGISSDDDHTCGLIEQAYNHWPNDRTMAPQ